MRRAADHVHELVERISLARVYLDMDGTLVGPGGSLFTGPGRDDVTGEPASALAALAAAGIDVVVVSGRTQEQVREVARTIGAAGYVAELGGVVVAWEGRREVEVHRERTEAPIGTVHDSILRTGAAGFLLDRYAGRLEPHGPWAFLPRGCSVLLRGLLELPEANGTLAANGYGWLELVDNGTLFAPSERFPALTGLPEVHAYHLVPTGVGKRSGVAIDRLRAGLEIDACIALGDAPTDVEIAPEVAAVFVVANGRASVEGLPDLAGNVFLLDRPFGLGVAEAVRPFLPTPEPGA